MEPTQIEPLLPLVNYTTGPFYYDHFCPCLFLPLKFESVEDRGCVAYALLKGSKKTLEEQELPRPSGRAEHLCLPPGVSKTSIRLLGWHPNFHKGNVLVTPCPFENIHQEDVRSLGIAVSSQLVITYKGTAKYKYLWVGLYQALQLTS